MSGKTKTVTSSLAIILAFGAIFALVAYLRNGPLKMFNSEAEQTKECSYLENKYNERFIKYSEGDTTMYVPESNTAIGVTVTEQEGYLFDDYTEQKTQYELKNDLLSKMQNDCVISSKIVNGIIEITVVFSGNLITDSLVDFAADTYFRIEFYEVEASELETLKSDRSKNVNATKRYKMCNCTEYTVEDLR